MKQVWPIRPPVGQGTEEPDASALEDRSLGIEAMEQRLQAQGMEGSMTEAGLCVWYACTDVCPPGG